VIDGHLHPYVPIGMCFIGLAFTLGGFVAFLLADRHNEE
jgi:hypothetical protein